MLRIIHLPRRFRRVSLIGILGILLLVLSACGPQSSSSTTVGSGSTTSTPTPRPTSTPTSPATTPTPTATTGSGYGSVHGCPSDAIVTGTPLHANVTLKITDINSTVVAHVGDTIEVLLPFGQKWTGPSAIPTNLQEQQPTGYASATDNVCVWHFVAQKTGTAKLDFASQALCLQGTMCPMYIALEPFTVDVQ